MKIKDISWGAKLITPDRYTDTRGAVSETWHAERYAAAGMPERFVQSNLVRVTAAGMRGLHYQRSPGQAKLVTVMAGTIIDVYVDIRPESETFGNWGTWIVGTGQQIYLPVGYAHGFLVPPFALPTIVSYLVSAPYDATEERTLLMNDPERGYCDLWPDAWGAPMMSERDLAGETWAEFRKRVGR